MTTEERIKKLKARHKALEDVRSEGWDEHWKDIIDYILPHHGQFAASGDKPDQGKKKQDKIIDATATRALRVLAAGMQGGLTSPARPWFRLGLPDRDLMDFGPVRTWLDDTERRMYDMFARSNFYSTIHTIYTELPGFGTACCYAEEDEKDDIRFLCLTIGEYCFVCDAAGRVVGVFRRIWKTAQQMVDDFGKSAVSDKVKQSITNNQPETLYMVIHVCQKRASGRNGLGMTWESIYFEEESTNKLLRTSGYYEQPFMGPKWQAVGSGAVYGRGPGMDVLPDVKMLQKIQTSSLRALDKKVDPAMKAPARHRKKLNLLPGGVNFYDSVNPDDLGPLYKVDYDIASTEAKIERIQMAVREGLFNDLFLMILERPEMTATEVMERHEEKMLMLGPVIERQMHELLNPCIDRTFGIGFRRGLFRPPPREIQGMPLKVDYISILAQAQRLATTKAINTVVEFTARAAEVAPATLDKIDFDEAVDQYADAVGAPARMIRSDDAVAELRVQREQKAREQEQLAQAMVAAEGAKTLSEAGTEKKSMLTDLAAALGGVKR